MSDARDELAEVILPVLEKCLESDWSMTYSEMVAEAALAAGYRKVFDGDCGLSGIKAPSDREAAEAWMRWANLASGNDSDGVAAMRQMLTEFGYSRPRTISTVEELDKLRFQAVVIDSYGTPYVCERHATNGTCNEWRPAGMNHLELSDDIRQHGPFTVAYEGTR